MSSVQPRRSAGWRVCVPRADGSEEPSAWIRGTAPHPRGSRSARVRRSPCSCRRRRPGHDDPDAGSLEQRAQPQSHPEVELRLAQAADDAARPPAVLDLPHGRARADRLGVRVGTQVVAGSTTTTAACFPRLPARRAAPRREHRARAAFAAQVAARASRLSAARGPIVAPRRVSVAGSSSAKR